jgi:hypothetical protein
VEGNKNLPTSSLFTSTEEKTYIFEWVLQTQLVLKLKLVSLQRLKRGIVSLLSWCLSQGLQYSAQMFLILDE